MNRQPPPQRRVAIIGGGISGLSAAYFLHARDPRAQLSVFDRSPRAGGVLQTERHAGFVLELGPDSLLRRLPWGMGLCRRLGLADEMVGTEPAAQGVYTIFRGRLLKMPEGLGMMAPRRLGPMVRTPILSWRGKLRMAAERFIPSRQVPEDETLAAFTRRRFGAEALQRIVQPLAGGIYMGDPEFLGMRAAFPQLLEAEREHGSLIKASLQAARAAARAERDASPGESMFVAPRGGFGQLVEALGGALPAETVRLEHNVERLQQVDGAWRVCGRCGEGEFAASFDQVVVAAPARVAAELLGDTDRELAGLVGRIGSSSCAVVHLAYPRTAIGEALSGAGIVVPYIEQRAIAACTFSSMKYPGRAEPEMLLLRVFVGGACQPERVEGSDAEIVQAARDELESWLSIRGAPVLERVVRWREAMPQYGVGHLDLVAKIERRAARIDGLELTGNAYRGVGIPHCIRQAEQAVERLCGEGAPGPLAALSGAKPR